MFKIIFRRFHRPAKFEDLPWQVRKALDTLVQYNWKDELDNYVQECGDGPNDNQRAGHIFESLVTLDNFIEAKRTSPRDYIPPEELDDDVFRNHAKHCAAWAPFGQCTCGAFDHNDLVYNKLRNGAGDDDEKG